MRAGPILVCVPRLRLRLPAAVAAVAVAAALPACSAGKDSVDQGAGGGYGFVQQASSQDFVPPGRRKPAPALSGPTVDGGRLDLADRRGRVVVVNFWASWCAPCRAETPGLVRVARAMPQVAFVGVNEKETSPSAARAFVKAQGVPYPSLVDRIGTLAARWPVGVGLPYTFVLDRQGRIAARFTAGVVADDLTTVVRRVLAEP